MAERMLRWDEASGELQEVSRRVGEYDTEYLMNDGSWQLEQNDGGRANVDTGSLRYYADDPGGDSEGVTGAGAVDNPAGWQNALLGNVVSDLRYWTPGTVLSQEEVQGLFQQLANPTFTNDAPRSLEQYLSDPRSVIRVEDGQYVYRPELAKGDYVPTNARRAKGFGGLVQGWATQGAGPLLLAAIGGQLLSGAGGASGATGVAGGEFAGLDLGNFIGSTAEAGAGAVYDVGSGLLQGGSVLGDIGALDLGGFIGDTSGAGTGAVYTPEGSLVSDAIGGKGLVDEVLNNPARKVGTELVKQLVTPDGGGGATAGGTTTAATRAPIDLSGVRLGVSPGTSKSLQMLSGGSVYDESGALRGGLISPYLKRA